MTEPQDNASGKPTEDEAPETPEPAADAADAPETAASPEPEPQPEPEPAPEPVAAAAAEPEPERRAGTEPVADEAEPADDLEPDADEDATDLDEADELEPTRPKPTRPPLDDTAVVTPPRRARPDPSRAPGAEGRRGGRRREPAPGDPHQRPRSAAFVLITLLVFVLIWPERDAVRDRRSVQSVRLAQPGPDRIAIGALVVGLAGRIGPASRPRARRPRRVRLPRPRPRRRRSGSAPSAPSASPSP